MTMKRILIALALLTCLPAVATATYNNQELETFSNISATTAAFSLRGGQYGVEVHAGTWASGSVTLERLAFDGSTYITCLTAFSADGFASVYLPSGTYKFVVASASGIYVDLTGIRTFQ
jgi:hypothetical protein